MSDPEDVRHAVGLARQLKGWSQKDLAREAGLHRVTVSRYETEGRNPSTQSEEALRRALGFSPEGWLQWITAVGRARREVNGEAKSLPRGRNGADPLAELMPRLYGRLEAALETLMAAQATTNSPA